MNYFKQQKEQMERQQFYNDIRMEVEFMIKTSMAQIKEEILTEVKQQIDIQVGLLLNGKKIDNIDIGKVVADEVLRQFQSSI